MAASWITLTGVSRFRIREELPVRWGYRRVVAEWGDFAEDRNPDEAGFDRSRLTLGLKNFFTQRQVQADWSAIDQAPGEHLVTSIAMMCPFAPNEKQALLEARNLDERARLLTALIEMTLEHAIPRPRGQRHPALGSKRTPSSSSGWGGVPGLTI